MSTPSFSIVDDFSVIEISGAQAGVFLQNQLTCDVLSLSSGCAILGACCDQKGRMLANFWVGRWENQYYLALPKTQCEAVIAHFKKYGVFSKISVNEKTDWRALMGCGKEPPALLDRGIQGEIPLHDGSQRQLYWRLESHESATVIKEKPEDWALLAFLAKLVFIQPQTRDLFLPQMIGLEKLGGVSFQKGCYLGQEVIARTQHLGQLKRHLHAFHIKTAAAAKIGDECHNASGETIGHVAAIACDSKNSYAILAVIQDRALTNDIILSGAVMEIK